MKYVTDAERKELNLREFVLRHLSAGAKKMEYQVNLNRTTVVFGYGLL